MKEYNRLQQFFGKQQWQENPPMLRVSTIKHCSGDDDFHLALTWEANPSKTINDLIARLSGQSDENADLQAEIEELKDTQSELQGRLGKCEDLLKQIFDPTELPPLGEFEKWRESLPPTSEFRGKHVAFIAGKGIIAFSDSLDDLMETALKKAKIEDLIIGFVPAAGVFI
jgi:Family of unknown function (DUF5678)